MDLLRDNPALTTAVVVGVGVVLVGSALSWLVRVAVLAGIVLAGLAVADDSRPAEQMVSDTYNTIRDQGVSRLPDGVRDQVDRLVTGAETRFNDVFTSDNVAALLEKANGGLDRLNSLADSANSDKGTLPETIRSLNDIAQADE